MYQNTIQNITKKQMQFIPAKVKSNKMYYQLQLYTLTIILDSKLSYHINIIQQHNTIKLSTPTQTSSLSLPDAHQLWPLAPAFCSGFLLRPLALASCSGLSLWPLALASRSGLSLQPLTLASHSGLSLWPLAPVSCSGLSCSGLLIAPAFCSSLLLWPLTRASRSGILLWLLALASQSGLSLRPLVLAGMIVT